MVKEILQDLVRESYMEDGAHLTRTVLLSILNNAEDYMEYMNEVLTYGCSGGTVNELIYTNDCQAFINENMEDIFDLYNALDSKFSLDISELAWFAYETTCGHIKTRVEDILDVEGLI